ncbi:hypothetical protein H4684_003070 [Desulfomicrobium macestii]|uniref:Uncharacterized protein n=1 Tax=Desulfomicrobium macestii TaxID=90731 RepID=A0ABR9H6T4_9BACT|nr:hypothetical protein [Desulfomicrobium macestii]MBE1426405.1 hypothetical protein [Desulfomicrobium macestii]
MKYAYMSVGQWDAVEQDLVAAPETRESILMETVRAIDGCPGARLCGVLAAVLFKMPRWLDVPIHWTELGERKEGEAVIIAERIDARDLRPDEWIVVVRPLQSIVSRARLERFAETLDTLPADCAHAVSTLPLPSVANPFWNAHFFELGRFSHTGWRMPARSSWQFDNIDTLCPELRETMKGIDAPGSQFLPDLHINDETLYAFRAELLAQGRGLVLPEPTPVAAAVGDTMAERLYCQSAPVFLLDKNREFDLSTFDNLWTAPGKQ